MDGRDDVVCACQSQQQLIIGVSEHMYVEKGRKCFLAGEQIRFQYQLSYWTKKN